MWPWIALLVLAYGKTGPTRGTWYRRHFDGPKAMQGRRFPITDLARVCSVHGCGRVLHRETGQKFFGRDGFMMQCMECTLSSASFNDAAARIARAYQPTHTLLSVTYGKLPTQVLRKAAYHYITLNDWTPEELDLAQCAVEAVTKEVEVLVVYTLASEAEALHPKFKPLISFPQARSGSRRGGRELNDKWSMHASEATIAVAYKKVHLGDQLRVEQLPVAGLFCDASKCSTEGMIALAHVYCQTASEAEVRADLDVGEIALDLDDKPTVVEQPRRPARATSERAISAPSRSSAWERPPRSEALSVAEPVAAPPARTTFWERNQTILLVSATTSAAVMGLALLWCLL